MAHSFVFPQSAGAFTEAAVADPQCAIAYWGIAVSLRRNPLILPLPAATLKEALEAVAKGKAIGAKTERERDWIGAIELYYKDYDKVDQTTRGLAYEKAMERLFQKYPDDEEAAIFYALALNETWMPSDKTYGSLRKAGAILEKIAAARPDHQAYRTISSTATIILRWRNRVSLPPTNMRVSLRRRSTPSICRRTPIRCLGCGRSRSRRTRNRWRLPRRRVSGSFRGRP